MQGAGLKAAPCHRSTTPAEVQHVPVGEAASDASRNPRALQAMRQADSAPRMRLPTQSRRATTLQCPPQGRLARGCCAHPARLARLQRGWRGLRQGLWACSPLRR